MAADGGTSIIQLLDAAKRDPASAPEFLAQVYSQLRALAHSYLRAEGREQTLQATAVVHEAYMRLVGSGAVEWDSPAHFFSAAAAAMRTVLIDHARARSRLKRGGDRHRVALTDPSVNAPDDPGDFIRLDKAIQKLSVAAPEMARIVGLRFFVGFDIAETAKALDVSTPTVKRHWQLARAWLFRELEEKEGRIDGGR
jgi:RNA polymerase sigma factor (TIGR02999 family)